MLRKKLNEKTGAKEYCLVSRDGDRVLEWFGREKPSDERVRRAEQRVQYFKHFKR